MQSSGLPNGTPYALPGAASRGRAGNGALSTMKDLTLTSPRPGLPTPAGSVSLASAKAKGAVARPTDTPPDEIGPGAPPGSRGRGNGAWSQASPGAASGRSGGQATSPRGRARLRLKASPLSAAARRGDDLDATQPARPFGQDDGRGGAAGDTWATPEPLSHALRGAAASQQGGASDGLGAWAAPLTPPRVAAGARRGAAADDGEGHGVAAIPQAPSLAADATLPPRIARHAGATAFPSQAPPERQTPEWECDCGFCNDAGTAACEACGEARPGQALPSASLDVGQPVAPPSPSVGSVATRPQHIAANEPSVTTSALEVQARASDTHAGNADAAGSDLHHSPAAAAPSDDEPVQLDFSDSDDGGDFIPSPTREHRDRGAPQRPTAAAAATQGSDCVELDFSSDDDDVDNGGAGAGAGDASGGGGGETVPVVHPQRPAARPGGTGADAPPRASTSTEVAPERPRLHAAADGLDERHPATAAAPWECAICFYGNGGRSDQCALCGLAKGETPWSVAQREVPPLDAPPAQQPVETRREQPLEPPVRQHFEEPPGAPVNTTADDSAGADAEFDAGVFDMDAAVLVAPTEPLGGALAGPQCESCGGAVRLQRRRFAVSSADNGVRCVKCRDVFHLRCYDLTDAEVPPDGRWVCNACPSTDVPVEAPARAAPREAPRKQSMWPEERTELPDQSGKPVAQLAQWLRKDRQRKAGAGAGTGRAVQPRAVLSPPATSTVVFEDLNRDFEPSGVSPPPRASAARRRVSARGDAAPPLVKRPSRAAAPARRTVEVEVRSPPPKHAGGGGVELDFSSDSDSSDAFEQRDAARRAARRSAPPARASSSSPERVVRRVDEPDSDDDSDVIGYANGDGFGGDEEDEWRSDLSDGVSSASDVDVDVDAAAKRGGGGSGGGAGAGAGGRAAGRARSSSSSVEIVSHGGRPASVDSDISDSDGTDAEIEDLLMQRLNSPSVDACHRGFLSGLRRSGARSDIDFRSQGGRQHTLSEHVSKRAEQHRRDAARPKRAATKKRKGRKTRKKRAPRRRKGSTASSGARATAGTARRKRQRATSSSRRAPGAGAGAGAAGAAGGMQFFAGDYVGFDAINDATEPGLDLGAAASRMQEERFGAVTMAPRD